MAKKSILTATNPDDMHAAVVSIALRELGHKADIWLVGDIPQRAYASFYFSDSEYSDCRLQHVDGFNSIGEYSTFWFRRLSSAQIFMPNMKSADLTMAENESREHIKSILYSASRLTVCVNGFMEAMFAEVKINQLYIAKQIGLKIPLTLVSNDPLEIRRFIENSSTKRIVYKPYTTAIWEEDKVTAFSYTSLVTLDDLPNDSILSLTPGIFQYYVRKKYELRVMWFGGMTIAVKIDSQNVFGAEVDWRVAQNSRLPLEKIDLPPEIVDKCSAIMRKLSLKFGCIDMIFSEEGEYIFLEVNQMGQFLWIEDINPEIELLDPFVQFIADPISFSSSGYKRYGISSHEFSKEAGMLLTNLQKTRDCYRQSAYVYR